MIAKDAAQARWKNSDRATLIMIENDHELKRMVWHSLAWLAIAAGLYLSSCYSYLLFHSLAEIFSVIVAVGIFIVAWHTRKIAENSYILLLN